MSNSLDNKIQKIVIDANKYAWDHYQSVLDLSVHNLSRLEEIIQKERLQAVARGNEFNLDRSIKVWGVYFGEIIKNTLGGIWHRNNDDLVLKVVNQEIFPIKLVSLIMKHNSVRTLEQFYKELCIDLNVTSVSTPPEISNPLMTKKAIAGQRINTETDSIVDGKLHGNIIHKRSGEILSISEKNEGFSNRSYSSFPKTSITATKRRNENKFSVRKILSIVLIFSLAFLWLYSCSMRNQRDAAYQLAINNVNRELLTYHGGGGPGCEHRPSWYRIKVEKRDSYYIVEGAVVAGNWACLKDASYFYATVQKSFLQDWELVGKVRLTNSCITYPEIKCEDRI